MDILEQFKQVLASHDWYFDYSDDHGVWSRGMDSWNKIQQLEKLCQAQGLGEAAEQLYQQFRKK
jgi:hypothetical protein